MHTPPTMSWRSTTPTRRPSFEAAIAAFWPPGPEPITRTSQSYISPVSLRARRPSRKVLTTLDPASLAQQGDDVYSHAFENPVLVRMVAPLPGPVEDELVDSRGAVAADHVMEVAHRLPRGERREADKLAPDRSWVPPELAAELVEAEASLAGDTEELLLRLDAVATPRAPAVAELGCNFQHPRAVRRDGDGRPWQLYRPWDGLRLLTPQVPPPICGHARTEEAVGHLDEFTKARNSFCCRTGLDARGCHAG